MKAVKMLLLVALFALMPIQSAFASGTKTLDSYIPMDDVFYDHWALEEMTDLINADIIDGYLDEENNMYVMPNDNITRAQFVKIIVSALGLTSNGPGKTFTDVKQNHWYTDSIRIASDLGIISGNQGKFYPNDNITRAEITKIIVLSFEKTVNFQNTNSKVFTDVDPKSWAYEYIRKASSAAIVNGNGSHFNPTKNATRAEAMVMIHRALQKEQSALPNDADLTAFLKDHITRENSLAETNSLNELAALYNENGTGYYLIEALMMMEWPLQEEDMEVTYQIDDENLNLQVLQKSNSFATVEATGMKVSIVIKSPDFNMDMREDMDGIYHLKKDLASGEWKIYNYLPSFDEEEFIAENL
ncbi:S-layer homology domain-containing protein [Niallia endozanthoxylica]|uniref:S-layer homology domain-containing protein n=1 Tax=Niallia endozanthoxylica TaxID=2036016 RepID=A0A5J5I874_9BACI|nr:S-layer homology domain-containing protein [Niallia endozanthoxylica]KAA9030634.1 S-layer homology domain-containing protein [Niallia endozanthoxylica]